ncbi:MAG: hypothetical protein JJ956_00175 [Pseudomonadales bacterium]|nr:hypothetical protein [Pseudomonadales bacterium]MBO6596921.1 hypothetical protein [Pseudomonadales bacterium]MBO6823090.1 hypothetical protein [Pseudomonadales bacterium]
MIDLLKCQAVSLDQRANDIICVREEEGPEEHHVKGNDLGHIEVYRTLGFRGWPGCVQKCYTQPQLILATVPEMMRPF